MSKIYISVSGGCVNGVLGTEKDIEVELWDWDNLGRENSIKKLKTLEERWIKLAKKLYVVF